jgi:hypothetical protein
VIVILSVLVNFWHGFFHFKNIYPAFFALEEGGFG